jgi:hypothetical protein
VRACSGSDDRWSTDFGVYGLGRITSHVLNTSIQAQVKALVWLVAGQHGEDRLLAAGRSANEAWWVASEQAKLSFPPNPWARHQIGGRCPHYHETGNGTIPYEFFQSAYDANMKAVRDTVDAYNCFMRISVASCKPGLGNYPRSSNETLRSGWF